MVPTRIITGAVLIGVLASVPALADQGARRRSDARGGARAEQSDGARPAARAVPRGPVRQTYERPPTYVQPTYVQPTYVRPTYVAPTYVRPAYVAPTYVAPKYVRPTYVAPTYVRPTYVRPTYVKPYYARPYPYASRYYAVPRIVYPHVVGVVPYRPYYYRPRFSVGVYYGAGGAYPYGYTPSGYYDPMPGRVYGGLRISDAPGGAQVFADGYYVGIVDDFDGAYQHMNLEAGEHRIEIREQGLEPLAFDVVVQPGRTITLRAY